MYQKIYQGLKALTLASLLSGIITPLPQALAENYEEDEAIEDYFEPGSFTEETPSQSETNPEQLNPAPEPPSAYTNDWKVRPIVQPGDATFLAELREAASDVTVKLNDAEISSKASIKEKDGRYFIYLKLKAPTSFDEEEKLQFTVFNSRGDAVELEEVKVDKGKKAEISGLPQTITDNPVDLSLPTSASGKHYVYAAEDNQTMSSDTKIALSPEGKFSYNLSTASQNLQLIYEYQDDQVSSYKDLELSYISRSEAVSLPIALDNTSAEETSNQTESTDEEVKSDDGDDKDQVDENSTGETDDTPKSDESMAENHSAEVESTASTESEEAVSESTESQAAIDSESTSNLPEESDSEKATTNRAVQNYADAPGTFEGLIHRTPKAEEVEEKLSTDENTVPVADLSQEEKEEIEYRSKLIPKELRTSGINESGDSAEINLNVDINNNEIIIQAKPLSYVSYFFGNQEIVLFTDSQGRAIYQPSFQITIDNSTTIINNTYYRYSNRSDVRNYYAGCRYYWNYGYYYRPWYWHYPRGYQDNRTYNDNRDYSTHYTIITSEEEFKKQAQKPEPIPPRREPRDLDVLPDTGESSSLWIWIGAVICLIGGFVLFRSRK